MNDLISRQAAIEAVGEVHPLDYNAQSTVNRIKKIPSAQEWMPITSRPMTEDERKEWSEKLGYNIDDDEAVIYGNLPDNGQRVLVYHKYSREIEIDTFFDDGDGCYFEENGDMDGITHWMPLPEKPKEKEE